MRAERASVGVAQTGMAGAFAGERAGDVALGVPGGDQGQRYHREPPVAGVDEAGHRVGHRRAGQLDEPAVHRRPVGPFTDPFDELLELRHPGRAAGPMPDDQQRGRGRSAVHATVRGHIRGRGHVQVRIRSCAWVRHGFSPSCSGALDTAGTDTAGIDSGGDGGVPTVLPDRWSVRAGPPHAARAWSVSSTGTPSR